MSAVRLSGDEFISVIIKDKNDKEELNRLRNPIEQIVSNLTETLLAFGVNVILDDGFWSQEERLHYLRLAKNINSSIKVFLNYLDIPKEFISNRIDRKNFSLPSNCFHVARNALNQWMAWFAKPD